MGGEANSAVLFTSCGAAKPGSLMTLHVPLYKLPPSLARYPRGLWLPPPLRLPPSVTPRAAMPLSILFPVMGGGLFYPAFHKPAPTPCVYLAYR